VTPLRAAVFASGRGSNFGVLADHAAAAGKPLWKPVLLVVDRAEAGALEAARERGIPSVVIPPGEDPGTFSEQLLEALDEVHVDLVLLAGYLRLMPPEVVKRFRGRMLNLHPALLPSFGGKGMYGSRVHEAVLEAGVRVTGITLHFVDEEYDRGPIFAQWPVPVRPGDTPSSLQRRIQEAEYVIYPLAVDVLARALMGEGSLDDFPVSGDAFHLTNEPPDFK